MNENVSPSDFLKMQEQAIRKAREMQQKAQQGAPPAAKCQKAESPKRPEKPNIYQQKSYPKKEPPKKEPQREKLESKPAQSNIFSLFSSLDGDMSLILLLIFILKKEGADEMLILALLYIMS